MLFLGSTEAWRSFHLKTNIAALISDGAGDVMCWRAIRSYCGWQWGNHFLKIGVCYGRKCTFPFFFFNACCHIRNIHRSQMLLSKSQWLLLLLCCKCLINGICTSYIYILYERDVTMRGHLIISNQEKWKEIQWVLPLSMTFRGFIHQEFSFPRLWGYLRRYLTIKHFTLESDITHFKPHLVFISTKN